jgi:dihydropteroate synthase
MELQDFQCGRYRFPLYRKNTPPLVMGILNLTPDSFSDGGRFNSLESALTHAEQMIAAGVDIIDIGGESSRPGAAPLPLAEELERVLPVVYALRDCGKPLSIDTYKPEVMREALAAGADMINDINGFCSAGAIEAVRESNCGLCVMHMQREPQTMQLKPQYQDVVSDVTGFLKERTAQLKASGIAHDRLCIDPGFGFGKTLTHNITLLQNIKRIQHAVGLPLLAGLSRKSLLAEITGRPVQERLAGSLTLALLAAANGAQILRVHDVAETVDALKVWQKAVAN